MPNKRKTARSSKSEVAGEAYSRLSLPEQVRLARPIAIQMLVEGITVGDHTQGSAADHVFALAGVPDPMSLLDDTNAQKHHEATFIVYAAIEAALALGIALGQCLTPQALNGGAR